MTPDDASLQQLLFAMRSQRMNYALAINSAPNAVAVEFDPPIANTMTPGMPLRIKGAVNNTGATTLVVDGDSHALRYASGAELAADDIKNGVIFEAIWNDGGYWEFNPYASGAVGGGGTETNTFINIPFTTDVGTVNSLVANFVPAITALVNGTTVEVKLANNIIAGGTVIKVNALAPVPVIRPDGSPLQNGDAVIGHIMLLIYSASAAAFQFFGIIPKPASNLGPVGSIMLTPANVAFAGTLKLNGAMLVRSEHPLLWAFANASTRIINEVDWQNTASRYWTAFSRGDGTTTFRLPDFRGEFLRFWDDARGADAGRILGAQQRDQVGEFSLSGTITLTDIAQLPVSSAQYWGAPGGSSPYASVQAPGDLYFYMNYVTELAAHAVFSGNAGLETRVRNAVVVPCIVDG